MKRTLLTLSIASALAFGTVAALHAGNPDGPKMGGHGGAHHMIGGFALDRITENST